MKEWEHKKKFFSAILAIHSQLSILIFHNNILEIVSKSLFSLGYHHLFGFDGDNFISSTRSSA